MADWYKSSLLSEKGDSPKDNDSLSFTSRRSPLICRHAAVASSQPLASAIGYDVVRQGGRAADAAVAMAAALAVTEPCSTGLGGDMFCLYYDASTRTVSCLNGSGRSPSGLTLDVVRRGHSSDGGETIDCDSFRDSALSVTVPGAAAGWEDLWKRHGSGSVASTTQDEASTTPPHFTMAQLVEPAALLAEQGFPVAPLTSHHWTAGRSQLTKWLSDPEDATGHALLTRTGHAPAPGALMVNPDMARVLRDLGQYGAQNGFYGGPTGRAMVDAVQRHGGCLVLDDVQSHQSEFVNPIAVSYHGYKLWQAPPNGQGMAGLIALASLDHVTVPTTLRPGAASTYHALIEMMRLGFGDWRAHGADIQHMVVDCDWLLNPQRIQQRAVALYHPDRATMHGVPDASSCTVSFQVVDTMGNAVSFVNSNYQGFGTGIVPDGCGFTLQNRGFGFSVQEGHPNAVGPSKRPSHTIIPGLLTHADTNELYATLSNMGGHMQPQGHLQLTVAMIDGNLDPQAAIDLPRFCIADGTQQGIVHLEEGVNATVVQQLQDMGHVLHTNVSGHERSIFGRAQIIRRDRTTGVLWAGSDGRADGCAMGF